MRILRGCWWEPRLRGMQLPLAVPACALACADHCKLRPNACTIAQVQTGRTARACTTTSGTATPTQTCATRPLRPGLRRCPAQTLLCTGLTRPVELNSYLSLPRMLESRTLMVVASADLLVAFRCGGPLLLRSADALSWYDAAALKGLRRRGKAKGR